VVSVSSMIYNNHRLLLSGVVVSVSSSRGEHDNCYKS
jgi:hypothetical protein